MLLVGIIAIGWPVVSDAQSRRTAFTNWADHTSNLQLQRDGCRRVALTQAPIALAGSLITGLHNPARDPNSQTDKGTESRYIFGGSLSAFAFMAGGSAVCWAGTAVQLHHAREQGRRNGFGTADLAATKWTVAQDEAAHHVIVGRDVTIAGIGLFALGGLAAAAHQPAVTERGIDRIGAATPLAIGGALAASIGGALWADGVARLRTLGHVPLRQSFATVALAPRGRHGVEATMILSF
jgi:hypothetical protein